MLTKSNSSLLSRLEPRQRLLFLGGLFAGAGAPALFSLFAPNAPIAVSISLQIAGLLAMLVAMRKAGAVRAIYLVASVAVPVIAFLLVRAAA